MQNQIFERILQGQTAPFTQRDLLEFQGFCSARSFSLDVLITASVTLFKINPDFSYQFLNYIDKHELGKPIYNDYQHQANKIIIYNNLTGLVLAKAARESSKEEADKLMGQAKKYLNSSEKVRMTVDKSIILNRAFLHYYTGQITKALNLVSRIFEQIQKTGEGKHLLVTAMLMLAQINFIKRNYQKALDLYKKCLETNKALPIKARIGMAYSFFYLGKYQMARACFQRIIKLNPSSVEAYIGIAVIYDREQNHKEYFDYISKAYKINKRHPLVLLHLSEHYLFRKQLHKCEKFCQEGLVAVEKYSKFQSIEEFCRNDYEELKVRFNNILGQVHHIHSNYIQAIKYYTLASGKGLVYNEIALAQCYLHPNTQNYIEAIRLLEECYKNLEGKQQKQLNDSYKLMAYLRIKIPPKSRQQNNAEYYYAEAIKFNRHDFDSKIQFANILVETNKSKALRLLEDAEKIQLTLGNEIKPELQNNIAVLLLENDEPQLCQKRLLNCMKMLRQAKKDSEEQQVKIESLKILAKFNYGLCLQRQMKWFSAKDVYEDILSVNKYHLDSALRLAYVWYQLGNYKKIVEILQDIDKLCEENRKILRLDRVISTKAYLLHLCGSSTEAKEALKSLGKNKDIYSQVLELCINYEGLIRKGVEPNIMKQFLRPSRQFCYKFCKEDSHATMAYMLLAIIFLVDKRFTKAQGIEFFNNLKMFSSDEIPTILFNMGFFLMNYDDYQNSIVFFGLYKDKVGSNSKTDQLIALDYLLDNNLQKAQSYVKRNIFREPCNLKFRLQHTYILERRSHQFYQKGLFKKTEVQKRLQELKYCMNTYSYLGKVSISEGIRSIDCPELKQRVRNIYIKVKACGEQRKFYIKSYLDSFDKVLKDLAEEQTKKAAEERKAVFNILNEQKEKELQRLLEDEEESEDEEQKARKQIERKKQRALELAKKRQAEMDDAWNDLKAKDQEMIDEKKSRKRGPRAQTTAVGAPVKKREKAKEKSSQSQAELSEEPQLQSESQVSPAEDDPDLDSEPKKKHKGQKKKKKQKHRQRHRRSSEGEQAGEEESQKSAKRPPQNEDNKQDQDLLKYLA